MTKRPTLASSMKALHEDTAPDPVALMTKARVRPTTELEPAKAPAASRAGMKRLLTPIEPQLHKRLKILAAQQDMTLEAITRAALESYLSKQESNL
jgi:hypothetical protein